ncbi:MAG: hypothetical protein WCR69_01105 [Sulfuricurvum sp.]|jgi:hypothetical protein
MQDILGEMPQGEEFIVDLLRELEEALEKVDIIAEQVQKGELGTYDGFMQSEEFRDKANEVAQKLKSHGIDIAKDMQDKLA